MRPRTTDGVETTWMMYPFVLADDIERTPVQKFFGAATCRRAWCGAATSCASPASRRSRTVCPTTACPNADRVMDHGLALPTYHWMSSDDAGRVVDATREWVESLASQSPRWTQP